MVQREVADRFFAVPSTKAYGAVSVLVQLAGVRTGFHPVSRNVFRPPPNVDSALVAFRRIPFPDDFSEASAVSSRERSPTAARPWPTRFSSQTSPRERAPSPSCTGLGLDPAVRAEALPPQVFVDLTRRLA